MKHKGSEHFWDDFMKLLVAIYEYFWLNGMAYGHFCLAKLPPGFMEHG
jgi:hypothetical protein